MRFTSVVLSVTLIGFFIFWHIQENIIFAQGTVITVTSPNGGEVWKAGETHTITWTVNNLEYQKVYIGLRHVIGGEPTAGFTSITDDGSTPAIENAPNNGSYAWKIPADFAPCTCRIEITALGFGENLSDWSDSSFTIVNAGGGLSDNVYVRSAFETIGIYQIRDGIRFFIPNADIPGLNIREGDIRDVTAQTLYSYPDALFSKYIRQVGDPRVYRTVRDGAGRPKKLWIPSEKAFSADQGKWADVKEIPSTQIADYPRAKLGKSADAPEVFYITESGLKRHIPNPETFNSYGSKWDEISTVSSGLLGATRDVEFIRAEDDVRVFKLEDGQKRWTKTPNAFMRSGGKWDEVAPVNTTELNAYPPGSVIE